MAGLVEDLEVEAAKLAKLDAELRARVPAEIAPVVEEIPSWYDSELAREIGITAGRGIGEVLAELFRGLVPSPEERERAAAAAIASTPAIVPAPVPVESKQLTSTSKSNESEIHVDGLVGHLDEDRRAPTLPTEPLSGHIERLDLESDVRHQVPKRRALSGPVIGMEESN